VRKSGGELVELPTSASSANQLIRKATFELTDDGTLLGNVEEVRTGANAANTRYRLLTAKENPEKVLESFLGLFLGSFQLQDIQIENLENIDSDLVLRYRIRAQSYGKRLSNLLLLAPRVLGKHGNDVLENGKKREYPIALNYRMRQHDSFDIALPAGFAVDELPGGKDVQCIAGKYTSKIAVTGRTLHYEREFLQEVLEVPVEHLDELKVFYRAIAADERAKAVLKKVD
jgi:hypothetical protein